MENTNGAQAFINALNAFGVERIFFNPGIDTVPILEAVSMRKEAGETAPDPVLCPHEAVAMTAALGNYMVSGKPQVVLVHSELGTQQIGGSLHNAQWGRAPVLLCAGLSGTAERQDWRRQPFDQGGAVRNCVKWDHQLGANEDLTAVVTRSPPDSDDRAVRSRLLDLAVGSPEPRVSSRTGRHVGSHRSASWS